MGYKELEICIVSDQPVRAKTILLQIQNTFDEPCNIKITDSNIPFESHSKVDSNIFLVDFMSINKPPKQMIQTLKELNENVKIIALHIYRSSILIKPLFQLGINGYIYYEPSRKDLVTAIKQVAEGNDYLPFFTATK